MAKATGKLRQDSIYHIIKEQGYRSRAAIKLLELDRSFRFLPTARAVLDLGAAPGGWLQVAVRGTTAGAFVVGVDVARIRPIRGAISLTEDITATARCSAAVRRLMDSKGVTAFDVVLHDGVGENKKRKRDGEETTRQSALVIDAIHLATMFLAPKGTFITKFVGSQDFKATMFCLKQLFEKVRVSKPMASRSTLPERYFVCLEYKAPAVIQPELFDLEHLLTLSLENKPGDEVRTPMEIKPRQGGTSTGVQPGDEFRTPMEIKPRQGVTIYGSFPSWKACCTGRASDFIWSKAQTLKELLGSFMGVSFGDPSSLLIKNHELTTDEIQGFCRHLDILDEKTLKHIWEWRTRLRKALSSSSQVTPKPDVTAVDASVKDDGQLVAKTEEFMSIIGRKTRREKHQSSCRAKEKAHKTTGMQIDAIEDGYCNADLLSVCAIKHGKELRAIGSAGLDMEDGIGDGGKEETQTHGGYNQEMDPDEERHRYEGMLDEAHKGFIITNGEVKQQRKHMNAINPYAKADLLEERKEKALAKNQIHVKKYTGNPYWWIDG